MLMVLSFLFNSSYIYCIVIKGRNKKKTFSRYGFSINGNTGRKSFVSSLDNTITMHRKQCIENQIQSMEYIVKNTIIDWQCKVWTFLIPIHGRQCIKYCAWSTMHGIKCFRI
jgi:hypothetical protein